MVTFRLLYVLVFLSHDRRKIIDFNVIDHPTSAWTSKQLRNVFYDKGLPKFLIRDRYTIFNKASTLSVSTLAIRPIVTAYRSLWQNGYVERVIGSIRRECLDQLIIINERHLLESLRRYIHYYNNQRTHLGLNKDSPEPREVQSDGKIDKVAVANGLHHFYFRKAA